MFQGPSSIPSPESSDTLCKAEQDHVKNIAGMTQRYMYDVRAENRGIKLLGSVGGKLTVSISIFGLAHIQGCYWSRYSNVDQRSGAFLR